MSRTIRLLLVLLLSSGLIDGAGANPSRSRAVVREFRASNPCPSTGNTGGACPGYQVDHREALICGGRDEVANLQWLGIEEHKAKTRVEVKLCRPRTRHRSS